MPTDPRAQPAGGRDNGPPPGPAAGVWLIINGTQDSLKWNMFRLLSTMFEASVRFDDVRWDEIPHESPAIYLYFTGGPGSKICSFERNIV